MKPKKGLSSRTNVLHLTTILAAVLMAVATRWLPGVLTTETAGLLAAAILAAVAGRGAWLKADDRKKVATAEALPTVGEVLERKAVFGADRAHPRCEQVAGRHRCTGLDGHEGPHSVPRGVML